MPGRNKIQVRMENIKLNVRTSKQGAERHLSYVGVNCARQATALTDHCVQCGGETFSRVYNEPSGAAAAAVESDVSRLIVEFSSRRYVNFFVDKPCYHTYRDRAGLSSPNV